MNASANKTQNANAHESAFGRPANWWAAWPAVAVGLTAFLLAVYGTFWLPRKLPMQYARALAQTQQRYQKLVEKPGGGGSERLIDTAGDMDVIYSRLVGLEGNSPERYWQWAEFQQAHADRLNGILQDPAQSLSPAVRKRWSEQAEQFHAKSHEILDQLALRPSELQAQSVLHVAQRKYRTGLGELGVREASSLAESLANMLAKAGVGEEAALTPQQIQEARLLLVQLQMEAAWQTRPGSSLTYSAERLEKAWELLEGFREKTDGGASGHIGQPNHSEWQATRGLLAAMTGRDLSEALTGDDEAAAKGTESKSVEAKSKFNSQLSWSEELSELQLAAVDENWIEVTGPLGLRAGHLEAAVTSGLARTLCRLTVSPWEDGAEHTEAGVLLAAQLAPHLPETAELLWESARVLAGQGSDHVRVPARVTQTIMAGQSGWLKYSLAALSATLEDKPDVARTHLLLLGRAQGNTSLVARVALWRSQVLSIPEMSNAVKEQTDKRPEGELNATSEAKLEAFQFGESQLRELAQLTELLNAAVQVEPKSGLNWFVLGTLQFRAGEFEAMQSSLSKAQELLGDVPAIEQMLEEAGM